LGKDFDPVGDFSRTVEGSIKWWKIGTALGRRMQVKRVRKGIEAEYGYEIADAVEAAIMKGRDYQGILERAGRDAKAREARDQALINPPALHGSARWATPAEVSAVLKDRSQFDAPRSVLLGAYRDHPNTSQPEGFVHWDGDGHLFTLAPTRSGKARTTIIPNLLRYRGSAVVLDPKGELYAATSAWRAANVGPVYRLAPFDDGSTGYARNSFDPLAGARTSADRRSLARLMFPHDPKASEFFGNDAVTFMVGLMAFIKANAPENQRNLALVCKALNRSLDDILAIAERMKASGLSDAEAAGVGLLDKRLDARKTLLETIRTTLGTCWADDNILSSMAGPSIDFASLKDRPATVYLDIPFHYMAAFSPWLRVVIKAALDAMLSNPRVPAIPVLFVLDEFLSLERFPECVAAMRTHAGAGVRIWYFVQDMAGLKKFYPDDWEALASCAVRQFFGINDPFSAELVTKFLGTGTVAHLSTTSSSNISAQGGGWMDGGSTTSSSNHGESVSLHQRPLLTAQEVMATLSGWREANAWRESILSFASGVSYPFKADLVDYSQSTTVSGRIGAFVPNPKSTS
jgi:type IV secretion system protein VirD4